MPETLRGNLIVGQSGGPTAVINSSLVGVIHAALEAPAIEQIYGALNGIEGVLHDRLVDLGRESASTLEQLRYTPAAALGSCRHKVTPDEYERILDVFQAHNVRFFFYIGGNDSMDTAHKVAQLATERNYPMRVIGIPKTVDNDLAHTDHCPGYGSAARFVAMAIRDTGMDTEAMGSASPVKILEVMGRNAGWLTAAAALAKDPDPASAPHLIYIPEHPVTEEQILDDIQRTVDRYGRCVIALSEGVRTPEGKALGEGLMPAEVDAFGHKMKGGAGDYLVRIIPQRLGLKARLDKPNYLQRSFMAAASPVDLDEAYRVGRAAVQYALQGHTDQMVTLVREPGPIYRCTTGLAPLAEVANAERKLPAEYINSEGNFVTPAFLEYAAPLIGGPLPAYARLARFPVEPKAPAW